jgi:WS/DGAT/MGAT family acyltransferase
MRQLLDLASAIVHDPFDRTRPLWEFVIVEGLEGGRAAMIQKLHHAVTDGVGGIRMSEQFIDIARDATEPIAPDRPVPDPLPTGFVSTSFDTLTHGLRRGLGMARRGAEGALATAVHPRRAAAFVTEGIEVGQSALRQLVVTDGARSPLWTARSLRRHMEVLQAPLDDAKAAAKGLGGSLNDLFVTAAAGGAGAYHRDAGTPVDELRMAMPVNTRTDRSAGGNAFTPSRVLVPAGIEDPVARFDAVRARLHHVRGERSLGMAEGFAGLANLLPTSVLTRLARQQVETVDFTTSNIRGAPFPLYIAGARILANHPIGPLAGTAWNLTLMSYDGSLDMGLNVDAGAVDDPEALRDAIEAELTTLIAARRRTRKAARRPRRPASGGSGAR